ncbi:MAG: DUF6089 family protein [Bacteroidales bacterium]|jgi:hypothetical protein|nr:DUF6089 family protein [Bacteroidales bacterium]
MKKLVFCILASLLSLSSVFAQRSEIGGFVGGAFYLGDLNPTGLFSQTQFAAGGVYRYNLTPRWALRGNAFWGTVMGDDAKYDNPRNLSFRSRIMEFSVQAEINYLTYFTGSKNYRFTPYLFGGVAVFSFNPQTYYDGQWIDLAPLHTEGQGLSEYPDKKPYSTTQLAIPFGLGFKYSLNAIFSIGLEWGMRLTFTDYLDDVSGTYADPTILAKHSLLSATLSNRWDGPEADRPRPGDQRGNSNKRDWYSFAGVTITAKIGQGRKEPCPSYKSAAMDRIKRSRGE